MPFSKFLWRGGLHSFIFIVLLVNTIVASGNPSKPTGSSPLMSDPLINCEMTLSNVGPLITESTPLANLDIHLFRLSLEKVTKQKVSLVQKGYKDIFALPLSTDGGGHLWTVEVSSNSQNMIFLNSKEKRLVLSQKTNLSQMELEALIRQWLVGHPWHPYTSGKNLRLKPFQKEALEVYKGIRDRGGKKLLIVSPGSTGKTVVFKKIIEDLEFNPSRPLRIILADQRMALRQLKEELSAANNFSRTWGDANPQQNIAELMADLQERSSYFLFSTIQSFKLRLLKASPEEREALRRVTEIVIYDEAHHSGAAQARVLLPEWLGLGEGSPFFLGSTATPVHLEVSIQDLFDNQVFWAYLDRAEDVLQGKIKPERSVSELITQLELAIREGDITPIEHIYFLNTLDLQSTDLQRDEEELFITERVDEIGRYVLNPYYYPVVFSQLEFLLRQEAPGFIATATIAEAERVQDYLNRRFPEKNIITLHSNLADAELVDVETQLRSGEIDFVVTVKMLDESINLLGLQTYIDLTSSASPRQLIQRMSRVTRLNTGKHFAHVALFLNINEFTVRESLELVDRLLTSQIKGRVRTVSKRQLKNLKFPDDEEFLNPQYEEWRHLKAQLSAFWESSRKTTTERFQELDTFILERGLLPSPKAEDLVERSLGGWLNNYKRSRLEEWFLNLSEEAQLILKNKNLLGRIYKTREERFKDLEEFIQHNGELPSSRSENAQERSLGSWFVRYRRQHPQSWYLQLSETALNRIQLQAEVRRPPIKSRELRIQELNHFILKQKRLPSVGSPNSEEKSLAHWLAGYKQDHAKDWHLSLSQEAQKIIKDKNLFGRTNKKSEERISELNSFILEYGRLPASNSENIEEKSLARWMSGLKQSQPKTWFTVLSGVAQKVLNEKNLLDRRAKTKEERLQELNLFIVTHRRLPSGSSSDGEEKSLRRWWLHYKKNQPQDWQLGLTNQAQSIISNK